MDLKINVLDISVDSLAFNIFLVVHLKSLNILVSILSSLRAGQPVFDSRQGRIFFSSPSSPGRLWDQHRGCGDFV
jgi:hypothetical protein